MVGHSREQFPGQMEENSPIDSFVAGKRLERENSYNRLEKSKSSMQFSQGENPQYNLSNYQSEQQQLKNYTSYASSQQSKDEENTNSECSSSVKKARRTREDRKKDKSKIFYIMH